MIEFEEHGARFSHRAAGVVVESGRALLQRSELDPWWVVPGGRVEMRESAEEAMKREMREELGVDVTVERLLWILENFFEYDSVTHHAVELYFLVALPRNSALRHAEGLIETTDERGGRLFNRWVPIDALAELEIRPTFLRDALASLPEVPTHIVHRGA